MEIYFFLILMEQFGQTPVQVQFSWQTMLTSKFLQPPQKLDEDIFVSF